MISAIIMASGFGRRMGINKLFLPYKGKLPSRTYYRSSFKI